MYFIFFNPYQNLSKEMAPFYRCRNLGSETLGNMLKVTQILSRGARFYLEAHTLTCHTL